MITTQRQLRKMFWAAHPYLSKRKKDKVKDHSGLGLMYPINVRLAWNGYLEQMRASDQIDVSMFYRSTLEPFSKEKV
jgi:hypothetical protein